MVSHFLCVDSCRAIVQWGMRFCAFKPSFELIFHAIQSS